MGPSRTSASGPVRVRAYAVALAAGWTVVVALLLAVGMHLERQQTRETALLEARAHADKDQAFRAWAVSHGGVYVPVDSRTAPNPHLSNMPERDVITPSGRRLTLMNSAYMLRQVMTEFAGQYGARGRLVSLRPLNRANTPDPWEREALHRFERGAGEVTTFTQVSGEPYLRLMRPLVAQRSCLACHGTQGYRVGDIRGGIGILLPIGPLLEQQSADTANRALTLGLVWLIGLAGIVLGARDLGRRVAERERLLQEITAAKEQWETTFDTVPDLIMLLDAEHTIQRVNRAAADRLGFRPAELIGRRCYEVVHGTTSPPADCPHAKLCADGHEHSFEAYDECLGGWFHITATPLAGPQRGTPGSAHVSRDITDRKNVEQELRRQKEVLSTILDAIPVMVSFVAPDGRHQWANRCWEETLGWSAAELDASALLEQVFPDEEERRKAAALAESADGQWADIRMRVRGGHIRRTSWAVVRLSEGSRIAIGLDVTERVLQEEERRDFEMRMQHTQRLESLGVLAGGVAHDFNNLLTGVLANVGLALMNLPPEVDVRGFLEEAESATLRATELANQMLAYSGRGRFAIQRLDLSLLVEEMGRLLATVAPKAARFHFELAGGLPPIEGDAAQIRQVVMNLITNAGEALAEREGDITVRTGIVVAERGMPRWGYLAQDLPEGTYVELEVTDTGCGMDEETRARVFEPFFTTKFTGRGLGMAAVLGIVRGHRGAIHVESRPWQGTTFRLLFPAAGPASEPASSQDPPAPDLPEGWRGSGTVLVVDDEPGVREVAEAVLDAFGFRALVAADGAEGLEVFRRHADEVSIVVLDLTMPRMGGEEALDAMRAVRPDVRVLLSSGYAEEEATRHFAGKGLAGFLQKPYRPQQLLRKLREVLG